MVSREQAERSRQTCDFLNADKLLVTGNGDGLNQKFISALSTWRGILLHRLQEDWRGVNPEVAGGLPRLTRKETHQ